MKKKVCGKCGNTIDGTSYSIGNIDYCWGCSRLIYTEYLEKAYPTPEKKLMGIIEHLDTLNNNIENQEKRLSSIAGSVGGIYSFLIITFILGVIVGIISVVNNF